MYRYSCTGDCCSGYRNTRDGADTVNLLQVFQLTTAPIPGWTYEWSPTTGLDNPNVAQPTATITGEINGNGFDAEDALVKIR